MSTEGLERLAESYGVELEYHDVFGTLRRASPEALLCVLRALGAEIEKPEDTARALEARRRALLVPALEPVLVRWDDAPLAFELQLDESVTGQAEVRLRPADAHDAPADVRLHTLDLDALPTTDRISLDGRVVVRRRVVLDAPLPTGYFDLTLAVGGAEATSWVVSAPRLVPQFRARRRRGWGVFAPTYALRSDHNWGIGDYSDLARLVEWASGLGADFVGTLPLLSAFLDEPFEASPYSSASRLFYNEVFVDVDAIVELDCSERARTLRRSPELGERLLALRADDHVDYREQMAHKRRILEALAVELEQSAPREYALFDAYRRDHPRLADFARFRAVADRLKAPWQEWPEPLREGRIPDDAFDPNHARYHEYVQWTASRQMAAVARAGSDKGTRLYLDLPLGVQPSSYDVYREREIFVLGTNSGAPPDGFFTEGQAWGTPPLHPERLRQTRYRYVIETLRHHLPFAGVLRLDHVMGLHRLFVVPNGMHARQGVYVNYREDELYAILSVEAHRTGTAIVGEDLGTVPDRVRERMAHHGLRRMFVTPFEMRDDPDAPLGTPPSNSLACLDTHDMVPFAGYAKARDIHDRARLGLCSETERQNDEGARQRSIERLFDYFRRQNLLERSSGLEGLVDALHCWLASSPAEMIVLNLEDLWLEESPQNMPGTGSEEPNWRRKHRLTLEAIAARADFREALERVDHLRT